MKKLIFALAVIVASCSSDSVDLIEQQEMAVKEVTLDMSVLLSRETIPFFQRRSTGCSFPEYYKHKVSSSFNVYFIPTTLATAEPFSFSGVIEGKTTFKIPAIEYRVVVTNSDKKNRAELPIYSDVLYLYGESVIDFSNVDTVDVEVTNDYTSIMVVKNTAITSVPEFAGVDLYDVGEYYNIYYRSNSGSIYGKLGLNNYAENHEGTFLPNQVYRFMLCPEGNVNIIVEEDILTVVNDIVINE